jgi:serine/threonine protein kinase
MSRVSPHGSDSASSSSAYDAPELRGLPARFRPERPLGRGSQRSVHLARDTEQDRWVAVSVFDTRELSQTEIERVRLLHALAGSGGRPHVLAIDHVSEADGTLFMVSPFLMGGDLGRRLEEGGDRPLSLTQSLRIGSQVCHALEGLHASGITHCDVKPSNVLLDERGDAYLGDFGLAMDAAATVVPGVSGTPAYLAPEQVMNRPGGAGADLYSVGCLLYELTTGRPPFVGERASDVIRQHQAARPVPPIERNPEIPGILNQLILMLLEKNPDARPSSAGDVRAALEGMVRSHRLSPSLPESVERRRRTAIELPLAGRENELEMLEAALSRTCDSMPGLVLVSAEAGGGKSRLLAELRARAEARGCATSIGIGDQLATTSYQPFAEALLPLSGHLSALDPTHRDLLRDFLYGGVKAPEQVEQLTPRGAEQRLFSSIFALLNATSRARPLVLLLEDLHAFDPVSIGLFEHLAYALLEERARRDLALLVVASTRSPTQPRLVSLLAELRKEHACESIELAPLDERAVFGLLSALGTERRPPSRIVHDVVQVTSGNPLFVREVAYHLRDAGLLDSRRADSTGEPWDVEIELPATLGHAISGRIDKLGSRCRELLALGALLGARFDPMRLALVSGYREAEIALALDEAVEEGLLVENGASYTFAHPLMCHGIRDRIGGDERHRLHLRIARQLQLEGDPGASMTELAHHLARSGPLADPTELARVAAQAAEQALARYSWHEAAELLEAAIEATRRGAKLGEREQAELHRSASHAYFSLLDTKPCDSHCDAAISCFERAGDEVGLARALNDRVRIVSEFGLAPYSELADIEPLERALARLDPAETALRAQILNTLAESYWIARQPERAEQLAVETLEVASRASDHRLCGEASVQLGLALLQGLRVEESLSTWQAGLVHARKANDLLSEEQCLVRSSLALAWMARFDEVLETIQAVRELNRVLQLQGEMAIASAVLLAIATVRGDFEAAERHATDALDRVRRIRYPWATLLCVCTLTCARALQNDVVGARRALQRLSEPGIGFEQASAFAPVERCLGWLTNWYAGDTTAIAIAEVEQLLPEIRGRADLGAATLACALVELADALQAPALADAAEELLGTIQRLGFVFCCGWPFFVPRLRGVAAALTGKFALAELQLTSAIAIAERVGASIELARSRLDLARMLATRNSDGDRDRARQLVAACRPAFASHGPAAFFERADRLQAFLAQAVD